MYSYRIFWNLQGNYDQKMVAKKTNQWLLSPTNHISYFTRWRFTHSLRLECLHSNSFTTMTKYKCLVAMNVIMSDSNRTNTDCSVCFVLETFWVHIHDVYACVLTIFMNVFLCVSVFEKLVRHWNNYEIIQLWTILNDHLKCQWGCLKSFLRWPIF